MKNDKHIRMKGKNWSSHAIAIEVPTKDIAIQININKKMSTNQAKEESDRLDGIIREWFEDSRILSPEHFLLNVRYPIYPARDRVMSIVLIIEINVITRKVIDKGDKTFALAFQLELERLIDELGLENRVESASE